MHPTFPGFDYTDPPTLKARLLAALPPDHRAALELVSEKAGEVYLVGGIVRDLLLGRPNFDLDFMSLAPAITLAGELLPLLQERFGPEVKLLQYPQFGTARLDLTPTLHLDLATARRELYPQPAALPTVEFPASLEEDARRRDFTINALALSLDGRLHDPFGGLADLRDSLLRVLHPASFVDDPTRMIRGVRFAARLNYRFEPTTETWLHEALSDGYFALLSAERRRNELRLVLKEARPSKGLTLLHQHGLLEAIHPLLRWDGPVEEAFERLASAHFQPDTVAGLAALLHDSGGARARQVVHDLRFFEQESLLPIQVAELWEKVRPVLGDSLLNSQLYDLFAPYPAYTLGLFEALLPGQTQRNAVERYRQAVAGRRPALNGNDLLRLGVRPGPTVGRLLEELRAAVLDGQAVGQEAEEAFIRQHLEGF